MAAFVAPYTVRFSDADHARIVYFPRYFHIFHCVFEDFFREMGKTYQQVLEGDGYGWPAVHASCDYKAPMRFGDEVQIALTIPRVGNKSATFAYRVQRGGFDLAEAQITVSCIDMKTFQSVAIPEAYREFFGRYAPD